MPHHAPRVERLRQLHGEKRGWPIGALRSTAQAFERFGAADVIGIADIECPGGDGFAHRPGLRAIGEPTDLKRIAAQQPPDQSEETP